MFSSARLVAISMLALACGPSVTTPAASAGEAGSAASTSDVPSDSATAAVTTTITTTTTSSGTPPDLPPAATSSTGSVDETGTPPWSCGEPAPPGVFAPPCDDPEQVMQMGEDGPAPSGYQRCADGRVHRFGTLPCQYPTALVGDCDPDAVMQASCTSDADCTAAPHGFCNRTGGFETSACECQYGCVSDDDCDEAQICLCDGPRSRCIPASCTHDGDCGGWPCLLSDTPDVCGLPPRSLACGSPVDACIAHADCDPDACERCTWSPDDCSWRCREQTCGDC